jgi:hypothetical protein
VPVRLLRRAVTLPVSTPLMSGTTPLSGVTRFALPAEPFRLDVAAPSSAWVVLLDDADHAVDVCAPALVQRSGARAPLSRCVVRGRGGSVVVVPAARAAGGAAVDEAVRFDLLRFAAVDEPARVLVGVREVRPRAPGRERLQFASSTSARTLRLEGRGVVACAVQFDDGSQVPACTAEVPAGQSGTVVVEHDDRPWRAALGAVGDVYGARFGALPRSSSASPLVAGRVEALGGNQIERTATTTGAGVLRVRATGGVCGVAQGDVVVGSEGLGGGCDLHVIADGDATWRLLVRSFGAAPLSGTLAWTFSPASTLSEGVGEETLVQPGEARVFRVDLASDGELGVGLQSDAEVLDCALLNVRHEVVADGCQQFGRYEKGTYWLRVEAPIDVAPRRFRPVVFGLKGADIDVPDDWLRDFFRRVPPPASPSTSEVRR